MGDYDDGEMGRAIRRVLAVTAVLLTVGAPQAAAQDAPTVLVARVEGPITPVVADHVVGAVAEASAKRHVALLVEMDTPGGLDTSMREIIQSFLGSDVPVIVWVGPSGGRAASAGALIGMASHVLAMAPGTAIGAATPVDLQGGDIERKIIEDAAAYAVSIARERGRNEDFARQSVLRGRSIPAAEAVESGVADLIARDRAAVLAGASGRTVTLAAGRQVTLDVARASFVDHEMSWMARVRQRIADPNIAFMLMSFGGLAILYELANPGMGFGGIVGVIMLLLAFFALSVLPVTTVGVLLLLLALGLFIAEVFVPGVGIFAGGGAIALVLAGVFLFEGSISVDLGVIVPVALVVAGAAVLAGRLVVGVHRRSPTIGGPELVGKTAVVSNGQVFLDGAWWRVRGPFSGGVRAPVTDGTRVRVEKVEGLDLFVEPVVETQEG